MKAYTAYCIDDPDDIAILVFANNVAEAKRTVWPELEGLRGCHWTDVRARLIHHPEWLWLQENAANPEKLSAGEPHVVVSPPCCARCDCWGEIITDGICETCRDIDGDDDERA